MIVATFAPGRELDQRVAIELMGWGWVAKQDAKWLAPLSTIVTDEPDEIYGPTRAAVDTDVAEDSWWLRDDSASLGVDVVPHYSTDIAAAWLVVDKMCERGTSPHFQYWPEDKKWRAEFYTRNTLCADVFESTFPLAVCLAALVKNAQLKVLAR